MHNILNQSILPKLGIFQNQWVILCVVAGASAVVVLALILIMLKRRKSKNPVNANLADGKEYPDRRSGEDYEFITKRIEQVRKKYKSILFASADADSLPITIPVNVAIRLAKNKKHCLLIDLDLRRDSIAKAFGLDSGKNDLRLRAIRTEFENLWVWPGHNFARSKQMNINQIVQKAVDRFDFILINAPSLLSSPDRRQIISAAQAAFICTKDTSEAAKLAELIKPLDCIVIGNVQILQ